MTKSKIKFVCSVFKMWTEYYNPGHKTVYLDGKNHPNMETSHSNGNISPNQQLIFTECVNCVYVFHLVNLIFSLDFGV